MGSEESPDAFEIDAPLESDVRWARGALGGFVAAIVMAAVIAVSDLSLLREVIAGLYLQEGLIAGIVFHVIHGTLFGILFAFIVSDPGLFGIEDHPVKSTVAGIVYGIALAIAGAGIIMPIWLNVVNPSAAQPVPNITAPLIVWHLVYGIILGAVYSLPKDL